MSATLKTKHATESRMVDAALDAADGVRRATASLLECFIPAQLRDILLHDLHGGFVFVELVS